MKILRLSAWFRASTVFPRCLIDTYVKIAYMRFLVFQLSHVKMASAVIHYQERPPCQNLSHLLARQTNFFAWVAWVPDPKVVEEFVGGWLLTSNIISSTMGSGGSLDTITDTLLMFKLWKLYVWKFYGGINEEINNTESRCDNCAYVVWKLCQLDFEENDVSVFLKWICSSPMDIEL